MAYSSVGTNKGSKLKEWKDGIIAGLFLVDCTPLDTGIPVITINTNTEQKILNDEKKSFNIFFLYFRCPTQTMTKVIKSLRTGRQRSTKMFFFNKRRIVYTLISVSWKRHTKNNLQKLFWNILICRMSSLWIVTIAK